MLNILSACVLFVCLTNALDLKFKFTTTKNGYLFPNRPMFENPFTYVVEGGDVIFKLAKVPNDFDECSITTPDLTMTYILKPNEPNDRVVYWDPNSREDGCGARIKSVTIEDAGRWKIKALNSNSTISYQAFLVLKVTKNIMLANNKFAIREGLLSNLNVTDNANYCEISNPFLDSEHGIFDKCQVTLSNPKKRHSGLWTENVGMYGKMEELTMETNITVIGEHFDVGYNFSGSKMNLYCNLRNPIENTRFSFCRFIKQGNSTGLRVYEGVSNGAYSYYGNGLHVGDCGITVEEPTERDYTYWKCSLGFYRNINMKFELKESFLHLVKTRAQDSRDSSEEDQEIFSAIGHPLNIVCKSQAPLKYCIITHPNTSFYSINKKVGNGDWKSLDLDIGICGVTIFNPTVNEIGTWQCQMNSHTSNQLDTVVTIQVRVGSTALAAAKTNLTTSIGSELTMKCEAVSMDKYLEYCRFTMPDGNGFSISENKKSYINDLYQYDGSSITEGDCQVTITNIQKRHIGKWMCAGKVRDSVELESYDFIYVTEEDIDLSVASISGITVGVLAVLAIIIIGIVYRKRQKKKTIVTGNHFSARTSASSEIAVFEREGNDNIDITIEPVQPSTSEDIEMTEFHVQTDITPSSSDKTSNAAL